MFFCPKIMLCCPVQYLDGVQGRVLHPLSLLPRLGRLVRPAQALSPLQISQSESIGKNQRIRNYNLHAWCNINKLADFKTFATCIETSQGDTELDKYIGTSQGDTELYKYIGTISGRYTAL